MVLTSVQRASVRYYLGYSDISQGGAPNNLERAMDALTAEAETIVVDLLSKLATLDTSLSSAWARAGIIEVDNGGVKWESGSASLLAFYGEGRRLVARLASMFGVTIGVDVYGYGVSLTGPCGLG